MAKFFSASFNLPNARIHMEVSVKPIQGCVKHNPFPYNRDFFQDI